MILLYAFERINNSTKKRHRRLLSDLAEDKIKKLKFIFTNLYSNITKRILLEYIPTEIYCTRANTLPVKEVWMVSDVCGKIR